MVASLARERNGLTAVRQQLEAGMVTLPVVAVLVEEARTQWAEVKMRLLVLAHTGLGLPLEEDPRAEVPSEGDLEGDPSAEAEVLLLLLAKTVPVVGLGGAGAGWGMEKQPCSSGYRGVMPASVDRNPVCHSKPEY